MNEQSHLLEVYPPFGAKFVRGSGPYLYDENNNEHLDFLAGIAVVSLGHANEEIADVISKQAKTLLHLSNRFENEFTHEVANKIDRHIAADSGLSGKVFFTNSGAEANECAFKIAKRYGQGKRFKFLTATESFHGRTLATLAATGQPQKHVAFEPLPPHFRHFEFGDLESLKSQLDDECVAVMIESVQGEAGVRIANQEFFDGLQQFCRDNSLLLILDEIQTGMCRTGQWFGFQHYGLMPDIVTMAKALGNGMPVGACWARDEVAASMLVGDHGSTFGGQPLALSVANKVLDIMQRDDLASRSKQLGAIAKQKFFDIGIFSEVRNVGLLIGADINPQVLDMNAATFAQKCLEKGLVFNTCREYTLRLAPPLIIDETHIEKAAAIMKSVAGG